MHPLLILLIAFVALVAVSLLGRHLLTRKLARQGAAMRAHGFGFRQLPGRGHMILLTAPEDCSAFIRKVAASVKGTNFAAG